MNFKLSTKVTCLNCPLHTPKEAYYFFPTKDDEYVINPVTNIPRRLIFEKVNCEEYLPYEIEKYNEFMEFYEKNHKSDLIFPDNWPRSETMKCLQATGFQMKKTIEKIKAEINYPIPKLLFEQYEEILHSGFLYMHGLDDHYRPILVANAKIFMELNKKHPLDHFICAIEVFMHYLFQHFFIPGQVENWVMIADINNVSIFKPPLDLLKIFSFLQIKYLCRLYVLYIYGMNSILNFCWKIVKKLVDEGTTKKFIFINSDNADKPFTHIHQSQLEEKYGGTSPNHEKEINLPFFLPSNDYSIDDNKEQMKTKDQYLKLALDNKLCAISPYLQKTINSCKLEIQKGRNVILRRNDTAYFECNSVLDESENEDSDMKNEDKINKLIKDEENEKSSDNGAITYVSDNKEGGFSERTTNGLNKVKGNSNRTRMITIFETKEENGGCCAYKNSCQIF